MKNSQDRQLLRDENSLCRLYAAISLLCGAALVGMFQLSKGDDIFRWFYVDIRDTGMDFFHSIEYVRGRDPYTIFEVIYPPLANALYLFLFNLIPRNVSGLWTYDFDESIGFRGTELDLRTYQAPLLLFILYSVVCAFLIVEVSRYILRGRKPVLRSVVAFCVLTSYGMLYGMERGNIILLAWPCAAFFVATYRSENKLLRELGLLALAVSAGIKLYPAIFGLLLLDRKEFKAAIRTVIYGVLSILVPMIPFHGGLKTLPGWIAHMFGYNSASNMESLNGLISKGSMHSVLQNLCTVLHIPANGSVVAAAAWILLALLVVSAFFRKKHWQKVLTLTLVVVMITAQPEYVYCFFAIPVLFLLAEEPRLTMGNALDFVGLTLLTADLPIFYLNLISYPKCYLSQAVMLILTLESICSMLASFVQKKR